jgi:antitoxin (DNA-binding transcriptional repressor) of toxin-antitoxin stability system
MLRIKTTDARNRLGSLINRVAFGREQFVLHRRDVDLAALVPLDVYRQLERHVEELDDPLDDRHEERPAPASGPGLLLEQLARELSGILPGGTPAAQGAASGRIGSQDRRRRPASTSRAHSARRKSQRTR